MTPPKIRGKTSHMVKTWHGHAEYLGYKNEKAMLLGLYRELGSLRKVGKKLGYCRSTVYRHMRSHGLRFNTKGGARRGLEFKTRFKRKTTGKRNSIGSQKKKANG